MEPVVIIVAGSGLRIVEHSRKQCNNSKLYCCQEMSFKSCYSTKELKNSFLNLRNIACIAMWSLVMFSTYFYLSSPANQTHLRYAFV